MLAIFINNGPLIWVNYNDLTATSLGMMVSKGNHPNMAARFRLVKYNLPRLMLFYEYITHHHHRSPDHLGGVESPDRRRAEVFFFFRNDAGDVGISSLKMLHSC